MRRLPTMNGPRGMFQLLYALIYLVLGYSYIVVPYSRARLDALAWLDDLIALQLIGMLWIIAGAAALVGSFLRPPRDQYSFGLLALVPTAFGFLYLFGWIAGNAHTGWATTCLFWAIAASAMVAAKGMRGSLQGGP